jgi:hypothetical protein
MHLHTVLTAGLAAAGLALGSSSVCAQEPPDGVEVLARGPIHEAYATTTEQPTVAPIVAKRPPDPVEELPPDQKPDGDNVQFIPGYWSYDEDRTDYVWISGFWRATPPGRVWLPGSWRQTAGGWQWTAGLWQETTPQQEQPQIDYLPPPPQPLEVAPATPAPTETSFYVPGTWVYRNRYVWRPGFWIEHRPGWVWTPSHYRWTPVGYVYVDGYWDYPLAGRGCLFAPVYFAPGFRRPGFVYTPVYVVREPCLFGSLFIRHGYGSYYFGDYFDRRYATIGFSAWIGGGSGFAIGINVRPHYDPLWDYYRFTNRKNPAWATNVHTLYSGRYNGTVARPPVTLVQQNIVIKNGHANAANTQFALATIQNVQKMDKTVAFRPVTRTQQIEAQKHARDLREVSVQRTRMETTLVERGQTVTKTNTQVRQVKLSVPKESVVHARIPADVKKAPPPPVTKIQPVVGNGPKGTNPKGDPSKGTPPKFEKPKGDPSKGTPPKGDPSKGSPPKFEKPKGDPSKGTPPKGDPSKGSSPRFDHLKNDPVRSKFSPPKGPTPKTEPPKADPSKPKGGEPMASRHHFDSKPNAGVVGQKTGPSKDDRGRKAEPKKAEPKKKK